MTCKQVRTRLDAFMDGELPAESMTAMRCHFEKCPCCSQEHQSLSILKKELMNLNPPKLDADFEDRLAAHVFFVAAQRPIKVRRRFQLASFAAMVAAALTLATIQSLTQQRQADTASQQKRFELDQDQAFMASEDQLSGGAFMMPASYGR